MDGAVKKKETTVEENDSPCSLCTCPFKATEVESTCRVDTTHNRETLACGTTQILLDDSEWVLYTCTIGYEPGGLAYPTGY